MCSSDLDRREIMHDSAMRPANYARSLLHIASGLVVLLIIQYLASPTVMLMGTAAFASFAWSLELGRRYSQRFNNFLMFFLVRWPTSTSGTVSILRRGFLRPCLGFHCQQRP